MVEGKVAAPYQSGSHQESTGRLAAVSPMLHMRLLLRRCRYWEVDDTVSPDDNKVPYRLEVVGVTCDPGLAVARGIWRKVRTNA